MNYQYQFYNCTPRIARVAVGKPDVVIAELYQRGLDMRRHEAQAKVPASGFLQEVQRLQSAHQYYDEVDPSVAKYTLLDDHIRDPNLNPIIDVSVVPEANRDRLVAELNNLLGHLVWRDSYPLSCADDGWIFLSSYVPPHSEPVWCLREWTSQAIGETNGQVYNEVLLAVRTTYEQRIVHEDPSKHCVWSRTDLVNRTHVNGWSDATVKAWKRLPRLVTPTVPGHLRGTGAEWYDR